MKFSLKIFLAVFAVSAAVLTSAGALILRSVSLQAEKEYLTRYQGVSRQLGDTFAQLDGTTDLIMANALRVVREREREKGLLSNADLMRLAKDVGVDTLFITDDHGRFLRSDWFLRVAADPALQAHYGPKGPLTTPLFSYCEDYRKLVTGGTSIEHTPIVPSGGSGWPGKFVMIPNHDRTRVLEADMDMRFIGDILKNVVENDPGVSSIGLFTPAGKSLGYVYTGAGSQAPPAEVTVAADSFSTPQRSPSSFVFFSRIKTVAKDCCECRLKGFAAPDGSYYYVLRTEVSRRALNAQLADMRLLFFQMVLVALALSALMASLVSRRLVEKLVWMGERVDAFAESGALDGRLRMPGGDEVAVLAGRFDGLMEKLEASQARLGAAEREKAFVELSRQVAHDIRSPLAALDAILLDASRLPETNRVMVRGAVGRIRDIANDLLQRHRAPAAPSDAAAALLLSGLIEPLVTEKRLQFRSRPEVEIEARLDAGSYGLFAKVQPVEFKRLLSNLINNSVEALPGGRGWVRVSLAAGPEEVRVEVRDGGKGISPEILERLGRRGETHGKEDGSGLGLFHARSSAEGWGGRLEIASKPGEGAAVSLVLPRAPAPEWFVSELALAPGTTVAVLDDDDSIHRLWRSRLETPALAERGVAVVHFSAPEEIRSWAAADPAAGRTTFLLDYELLGRAETGLSLAEELGLGERAILVTSRFEDPEILKGCLRLGARMIPKGLAGLVPVRLEDPAARERLDAILIDDDPLARMTWTVTAARFGKKFRAFGAPEAFIAASGGIDRATPLYVDAELENGVDGERVARRLHDLGFRQIFLATGHPPEKYAGLAHLRGVTGKEPPWGGPEEPQAPVSRP